jgi:hypothetical protein
MPMRLPRMVVNSRERGFSLRGHGLAGARFADERHRGPRPHAQRKPVHRQHTAGHGPKLDRQVADAEKVVYGCTKPETNSALWGHGFPRLAIHSRRIDLSHLKSGRWRTRGEFPDDASCRGGAVEIDVVRRPGFCQCFRHCEREALG